MSSDDEGLALAIQMSLADSDTSAPPPSTELPGRLSFLTSMLSALKPTAYTKMVIVVRSDLGMSVGKTVAQCCHATLQVYKHMNEHRAYADILSAYESSATPKITLKCKDLSELMDLQAKAEALRLPTAVIRDAGKTEIERGTYTCLAVVGANDKVNSVTGHLKLL